MKKVKNFNDVNVSKYKLKKGEVKVFKILKKKIDPSSPTGFYLPSAVNVPAKDTIIVNDEPKDIAAIRSVGQNGTISFYDLWFRKESLGTISCTGGSIKDQHIYEYLMLCNYRKNNPDRDDSKRAIFELIDPQADAKAKRDHRQLTRKAINYASEMSDEQIITFCLASGRSDATPENMDVLRNFVELAAEAAPEEFIKRANNRENEIKANIKRALDKKLIEFDRPSHTFLWKSTGELIVTIPRSVSGDPLSGILNFVKNRDAGESFYDEIKALLADYVNEPQITMKDEKEVVEPIVDEPKKVIPKGKKPTAGGKSKS